MEDREVVINPDTDYCSICGDVVDTSNIDFVVDIPLCKYCWLNTLHDAG